MLRIPLLFVTLSISVRKRESRISPEQRYHDHVRIRRIVDEVNSKRDRLNVFL